MATLKINVDANCLRMIPDPDDSRKGLLSIKLYPTESGGTVTVTDEGLYAPAPKGPDGVGGTGYTDGRSDNISIGYVSPYEVSKVPTRVNAHLVTHRTFTSTTADGSGINTRGNITGEAATGDYVLPGDIYRVKNGDAYDYYLVLSTNGGADGKGNTTVRESAFLVSVPISEKLCIND